MPLAPPRWPWLKAVGARSVPRARGSGDLIHATLARRFVGPKAQQSRPMPETPAGDVIEAHLDADARLQRRPFGGPLARPATLVARKARAAFQRLEPLGQGGFVGGGETGGEADVVQQATLAARRRCFLAEQWRR